MKHSNYIATTLGMIILTSQQPKRVWLYSQRQTYYIERKFMVMNVLDFMKHLSRSRGPKTLS